LQEDQQTIAARYVPHIVTEPEVGAVFSISAAIHLVRGSTHTRPCPSLSGSHRI